LNEWIVLSFNRLTGDYFFNFFTLMVFKLKNGVSDERLGLKIIENENIKAILDSVVKQQQMNQMQ